MDWPADHHERRPTTALTPNPRNARTHSPEQVRQVADLITAHGWTMPILIDERDGILAGHGRWEAAKLLGLTEVPVIVARGWSDEQKRLYALADNQSALNSGWDFSILRAELADLRDLGADIGLIGFSENELATFFNGGNAGLTDPDGAPDPPASPVSVLGDVWILGGRVTCPKCAKVTSINQAVSIKPK